MAAKLVVVTPTFAEKLDNEYERAKALWNLHMELKARKKFELAQLEKTEEEAFKRLMQLTKSKGLYWNE